MSEVTAGNAPDFDSMTPEEIAKAINAGTFDPESGKDNNDPEGSGY